MPTHRDEPWRQDAARAGLAAEAAEQARRQRAQAHGRTAAMQPGPSWGADTFARLDGAPRGLLRRLLGR